MPSNYRLRLSFSENAKNYRRLKYRNVKQLCGQSMISNWQFMADVKDCTCPVPKFLALLSLLQWYQMGGIYNSPSLCKVSSLPLRSGRRGKAVAWFPRIVPLQGNRGLFTNMTGVLPWSEDCGEPWGTQQSTCRSPWGLETIQIPGVTKEVRHLV